MVYTYKIYVTMRLFFLSVSYSYNLIAVKLIKMKGEKQYYHIVILKETG